MEAKRVLVFQVVVLTLLMPLLVTSGRHPSVGLPLSGKRGARGDLVCCDDCSCNDEGEDYYCTCNDITGGNGCPEGCENCDCSDEESCQCLDALFSCPDPCNSDYVPDKAPKLNEGKAKHVEASD